MSIKALLIAGTHSGCGKTSLAKGLMHALSLAGLRVAPFKLGPDYIDPTHHELACGVKSHNLDSFMLGPKTIREIFSRYAKGADIAVVEAMMGLYDGAGGASEKGSPAELAKLLDLPVLLVADASHMGRSAAALVKGFVDFDPGLSFAGVVLNRVSGPSHGAILEEALAGLGGPPLLGFLPRDESIAVSSRHLGLFMADEAKDNLTALAAWVSDNLDLDRIVAVSREVGLAELEDEPAPAATARLGLARDAAFCFYYAENLRLLSQAGLEIVEFSPLTDAHMPENLDGLYFGGGYPELYARELAANRTMLKDVKLFAGSGKPVYAECGGLMYLLSQVEDASGAPQRLSGVLGGASRMQKRLAALGYREITTLADSPLGPAGTRAKGHEFHYSAISEEPHCPDVYACLNRKGEPCPSKGYLAGNVLGSYVHLHFGSNPELAVSFAKACRKPAQADPQAQGREEYAEAASRPKPEGKALREGFTTGTAAAAAAKAAALYLLGINASAGVEVPLPQGGRYLVQLSALGPAGARAARAKVIKDAGDDPDVTDKAAIRALVELTRQAGGEVIVEGGRGVGRVTLPGLPVPVGEAAINPSPKAQIQASVLEALASGGHEGGCRVLIEVENGEEIARKTMNPKLGIVGGISILGTSGLVKPFSREAFTATIEESLSVARAMGAATAGLATGRRALKYLEKRRPDLAPQALVLCADFFAFSLNAAKRMGFEQVYLAAFIGKLVKMAQGFANTHAHQAELDFTLLARWCAESGVSEELCAQVAMANTAAQALEIVRPDPACPALLDRLAAKARLSAQRLCPGLKIGIHLFDFNGQELAATE